MTKGEIKFNFKGGFVYGEKSEMRSTLQESKDPKSY